jgi:hypothetical protein
MAAIGAAAAMTTRTRREVDSPPRPTSALSGASLDVQGRECTRSQPDPSQLGESDVVTYDRRQAQAAADRGFAVRSPGRPDDWYLPPQ